LGDALPDFCEVWTVAAAADLVFGAVDAAQSEDCAEDSAQDRHKQDGAAGEAAGYRRDAGGVLTFDVDDGEQDGCNDQQANAEGGGDDERGGGDRDFAHRFTHQG
jgi:hypothetical protein